jgi:hypothetical protein
MAKKKKVRVEMRKNRQKPPRDLRLDASSWHGHEEQSTAAG